MPHDLKPCPFCGSTHIKLCGEHAPEWWVVCLSCKASARTRVTAEQALEDWNTRAQPATTVPSDEREAQRYAALRAFHHLMTPELALIMGIDIYEPRIGGTRCLMQLDKLDAAVDRFIQIIGARKTLTGEEA